jgi:hypothetical protein
MIRMLLVGYCYGIRSERRLCREVDISHIAGSASSISTTRFSTIRHSRPMA